MKLFKILFPLIVLFISAAAPVAVTSELSNDYIVTINGTSNLHSWDEKVGIVHGNAAITKNNDGSFDIDSVSLNMNVRSIRSESRVMDNNTYKALKADAHPEITLALNEPLKSIKADLTASTVSAKCNLTIAGVTKPVVIQVKVIMPDNKNMQFEGAQTIKMTDYGVTPPVALFGMLVTGDEITIHFKTTFTITAI